MVAFVAWQQWKVAQNKLRLDLFDRRYKIYEAAERFVTDITSSGKFSHGKYLKFCAETTGVGFLLGHEVDVYLMEVRRHAVSLRTIQQSYQGLSVGDDRSRLVDMETEHFLWFGEQVFDLPDVFRPYLGFSHVQ